MNSRLGQLLLSAIGLFVMFFLWEIVGRARLAGDAWPPVSVVFTTLTAPENADLFRRATGVTVRAGLVGFAIGSGLALTLGIGSAAWPQTQDVFERVAVTIQAIPVVALGALFITTVPRSIVPTLVAAFAVFFVTFVATTSGLARARREHLDLFAVLGASRWWRLRALRIPFGLPIMVEGLKLAAPAAIIGAIVGEWFGSDQGIGPLLISAMNTYRIPLLWSAGILGAIPAMGLYGLMAALQGETARRFADD